MRGNPDRDNATTVRRTSSWRITTSIKAPGFWHDPPGLLAALLTPLAHIWTIGGRFRRAHANPYRAPIPVICIGGLVVGGSGKTPVVLSIAQWLTMRGINVHFVSRGFGGRLTGPTRVDVSRHNAGDVGDEAVLLAQRAPCWVATSKIAGVRAAVSAGAQVVLLDDGFQNPTIAKDLSLVVIDANDVFGNNRVMPAGPLREPALPGLTRANAVVLIGAGEIPSVLGRVRELPILRATLDPIDGERFRDIPVVAFAGIGRPIKFFSTLQAVGPRIVSTRPFADHHVYRQHEIVALRREADRYNATLVTTAKDQARLLPEWRHGIDVLDVELRWENTETLASLFAPIIRLVAGPSIRLG